MKERKFKEGDYIVITKHKGNGCNGHLGWCYKLINDGYYYDDHCRLPLNHADLEARLATPSEIEYYDKVRVPFDTTTIDCSVEDVSNISEIPELINYLTN